MKIKNKIFIIYLILIINFGCGSNLYLNKSYHFQPDESLKLAIFPVIEDSSGFWDVFLTVALSFDSLQNQEIIRPGEVRSLIFEDIKFYQILNKILDAENYKKSDDPALTTLLDKTEFVKLKTDLDEADIAFIPIKLKFRHILLHTSCDFEFRLYDLHDGALIYERYGNKTINVRGEKGEQQLSLILIALIAEECEKFLLYN